MKMLGDLVSVKKCSELGIEGKEPMEFHFSFQQGVRTFNHRCKDPGIKKLPCP